MQGALLISVVEKDGDDGDVREEEGGMESGARGGPICTFEAEVPFLELFSPHSFIASSRQENNPKR
jgi:hypothetical protein